MNTPTQPPLAAVQAQAVHNSRLVVGNTRAGACRLLSGPHLQAIADAIDRDQPARLELQQTSFDMDQFCSVVVPRMAGVRALVLRRCNQLSAAALARLSAALTNAGVRLSALECAVDGHTSDAVAALCRAHPSIERLCLPGLDDSDYHPDTRTRYTLIAALVRSTAPTLLRRIGLPDTPPPLHFDLFGGIRAPQFEDKVAEMLFSFEGRPLLANLHEHADAFFGPVGRPRV